MPWSSAYSAAGLDIYSDHVYKATIAPFTSLSKSKLNQTVVVSNGEMSNIVITLPTYASVSGIKIGVEDGSTVESPLPYSNIKPIVFYGSSITQGSSASRSSLGFPYLVAEYFDSDFVNCGFSGAARGEQSVAEDIAQIDMSAFIMEYDHNADTPADLRNTHYKFYKTIRDSHPNIPIVLISRISGGYSISLDETKERDAIILETFERAQKDGDLHIIFIDGCDLVNGNGEYLSDGKHPNDLGMRAIADGVIKALEELGIYG